MKKLILLMVVLLAANANALTKQELVDSLKVELPFVCDSSLKEVVGREMLGTAGGSVVSLKYYSIQVLVVNGLTASDRTISFYVIDEGGVSESAYIHGRMPFGDTPTVAQLQLLAKLKEYLKTYRGQILENGYDDLGGLWAKCIVKVFNGIDNTYSEKTVMVTKDGIGWKYELFK